MPKKVLIVEDNPQNMTVMMMTLERQGYVLLGAEDGEKAIKLVKDEKPDLILLDIQLPDIDGFELIERLRIMPEFGNNIIIAVTAYAMKGDKEKAMEAGCDAYVAKPFSIHELRRVVGEMISRPSQE